MSARKSLPPTTHSNHTITHEPISPLFTVEGEVGRGVGGGPMEEMSASQTTAPPPRESSGSPRQSLGGNSPPIPPMPSGAVPPPLAAASGHRSGSGDHINNNFGRSGSNDRQPQQRRASVLVDEEYDYPEAGGAVGHQLESEEMIHMMAAPPDAPQNTIKSQRRLMDSMMRSHMVIGTPGSARHNYSENAFQDATTGGKGGAPGGGNSLDSKDPEFSLPWDFRSADDRSAHIATCDFMTSTHFWRRMEWAAQFAFVACLPAAILALRYDVRSVWKAPSVLLSFCVVCTNKTIGRAVFGLIDVIKAVLLIWVVLTILMALNVAQHWALWGALYCIGILLISFLTGNIVTKNAALLFTIGMVTHFQNDKEDYTYPSYLVRDVCVGMTLGFLSAVLPRPRSDYRNAESNLSRLVIAASMCTMGLAESLFTNNNLHRTANLVKVRSARSQMKSEMEQLKENIQFAWYEPVSGLRIAELVSRIKLLDEVGDTLDSLIAVVGYVQANPTKFHTSELVKEFQTHFGDGFRYAAEHVDKFLHILTWRRKNSNDERVLQHVEDKVNNDFSAAMDTVMKELNKTLHPIITSPRSYVPTRRGTVTAADGGNHPEYDDVHHIPIARGVGSGMSTPTSLSQQQVNGSGGNSAAMSPVHSQMQQQHVVYPTALGNGVAHPAVENEDGTLRTSRLAQRGVPSQQRPSPGKPRSDDSNPLAQQLSEMLSTPDQETEFQLGLDCWTNFPRVEIGFFTFNLLKIVTLLKTFQEPDIWGCCRSLGWAISAPWRNVVLVWELIVDLCMWKPHARQHLLASAKLSFAMTTAMTVILLLGIGDPVLGPAVIAFVAGGDAAQTVQTALTQLVGTVFGNVFGFMMASLSSDTTALVACVVVLAFVTGFFRSSNTYGLAAFYSQFAAFGSVRPDLDATAGLIAIQQNTACIGWYVIVASLIFPSRPSTNLFKEMKNGFEMVKDGIASMERMLASSDEDSINAALAGNDQQKGSIATQLGHLKGASIEPSLASHAFPAHLVEKTVEQQTKIVSLLSPLSLAWGILTSTPDRFENDSCVLSLLPHLETLVAEVEKLMGLLILVLDRDVATLTPLLVKSSMKLQQISLDISAAESEESFKLARRLANQQQAVLTGGNAREQDVCYYGCTTAGADGATLAAPPLLTVIYCCTSLTHELFGLYLSVSEMRHAIQAI